MVLTLWLTQLQIICCCYKLLPRYSFFYTAVGFEVDGDEPEVVGHLALCPPLPLVISESRQLDIVCFDICSECSFSCALWQIFKFIELFCLRYACPGIHTASSPYNPKRSLSFSLRCLDASCLRFRLLTPNFIFWLVYCIWPKVPKFRQNMSKKQFIARTFAEGKRINCKNLSSAPFFVKRLTVGKAKRYFLKIFLEFLGGYLCFLQTQILVYTRNVMV